MFRKNWFSMLNRECVTVSDIIMFDAQLYFCVLIGVLCSRDRSLASKTN